jgi:hypothetical protein
MLRRKFAWISLALAGALMAWFASAQQYQAPKAAQAPYPGSGGTEYFAPNLGVYYRLVPYNAYSNNFNPVTGNYDPSHPPGGGYGYQAPAAPYPGSFTYGARLTRYPVANSPASYLQFEPGDMIISLDNVAIYGPNDVTSHRYQTSMVFVNIRTGQPQAVNLYIP